MATCLLSHSYQCMNEAAHMAPSRAWWLNASNCNYISLVSKHMKIVSAGRKAASRLVSELMYMYMYVYMYIG